MKTNDQNLENAVATWHTDSEPTVALRARVLGKASVTEIPLRHAPDVSRRRVWWVTGAAMAVSAVSIAVIATVSAPARPAFAEVEAEMSKIKTVQWSTRGAYYEVKTGNERHGGGEESAARLFPPAIRQGLVGDDYTILTPQWHIDSKSWRKPHRLREPSRKMWLNRRGDTVKELQHYIRYNFLPPRPVAKRLMKVQTSEVIENGKRLMRYQSGWGPGDKVDPSPNKNSRYTRVMWVDPGTRRAVRVRTDYYDHWQHRVTIADNFRYDEPLPDSLFDTSP